MKTTSTTMHSEHDKIEQGIILKLLNLLTQYKKDKNSLKKVFLYIRRLRKQKELLLSKSLEHELQELEVLEEAIKEGKLIQDNIYIIKNVIEEVIFTLKMKSNT